jgi:hypothetical protein
MKHHALFTQGTLLIIWTKGATIYGCYTESFFNFVDRFTALCFTATGAPPAPRCIRILPMNQHAWWPITFGMKGSNYLLDRLTTLCFTASSAVYVLGVCLRFVSSMQQLSAPLAICSQLQLVSSVVRHGDVYFRAACISVWHLREIQIC